MEKPLLSLELPSACNCQVFVHETKSIYVFLKKGLSSVQQWVLKQRGHWGSPSDYGVPMKDLMRQILSSSLLALRIIGRGRILQRNERHSSLLLLSFQLGFMT